MDKKQVSLSDLETLLIQHLIAYQEGKQSAEQILALGQIMYEMHRDIHPFSKNTATVITQLNAIAKQLGECHKKLFTDKSGNNVFISMLEKLQK